VTRRRTEREHGPLQVAVGRAPGTGVRRRGSGAVGVVELRSAGRARRPARVSPGVSWLCAAAVAGLSTHAVAKPSISTAQIAASSTALEALAPHVDVRGTDVQVVDVRPAGGTWRSLSWSNLDHDVVAPGRCDLRFHVVAPAAETIEIPPCAGRSVVRLDGREISAPDGPVVTTVSAGPHEVIVGLQVSAYERRVACGEPPRIGDPIVGREGLSTLRFASPHASQGGGKAVVYIPRGHDLNRPGPLLVGTHPWSGSMWTYAAYDELLQEAQRRDVMLLMPQGLGDSLYTAEAEDEVLRAIDALSAALAVDSQAVSIWGASMGGAGATTISFHHPDRFATATSFFGDSRYDRATYAGRILRSDAAAHAVNALDVVDNARHLPVWLIHGQDDRTSKIEQSEILADAMQRRGFVVRFDRVAGAGHEGALVARFLRDVVDAAATARVPQQVTRVTYRSVRPSDLGAYGVAIERSPGNGDAFVDIEKIGDVVHVHRADGVRSIRVARETFGIDPTRPPPIVLDDAAGNVDVAWRER
jgi:pimeloyl-ACP methyl ester carboxylesterase